MPLQAGLRVHAWPAIRSQGGVRAHLGAVIRGFPERREVRTLVTRHGHGERSDSGLHSRADRPRAARKLRMLTAQTEVGSWCVE